MKKILIVCSILSTTICNANPVALSKAKQVGENFLNMHSVSSQSLTLVKTATDSKSNVNTMYVFNTTDNNGFVIVAADDAIQPILAYSTENAFTYAGKKESPEVSYWVNGYSSQISQVIQNKKNPSAKVTSEWNALINNTKDNNTSNRPTTVAPLLTSAWDQLPWYNALSPEPGDEGSSTPSGCVATAMAQIMNFWQYPTIGTGSHSYTSEVGGAQSANFGTTIYDWQNMPDELDWSSTEEQINAVAVLMYHCGVAVDMIYGSVDDGGSGAYVIRNDISDPNDLVKACTQNALRNYFGYQKDIRGYLRERFTDSTWHKMLIFEIDNGRPILYVGYGGLGGHAFVFDGYDDNEMFHVNWGWGGSSNGYFEVNNLNPDALGAGGGDGNFNTYQQALVMIQPSNSTLPPNPFEPDVSIIEYQEPAVSATEIYQGDNYEITHFLKNNGSTEFLEDIAVYQILYDTLQCNDSNGMFSPGGDFEGIGIHSENHSFTANETLDLNSNITTTSTPLGAYYVLPLYVYNGKYYFPNIPNSEKPYAPLLIVKERPVGITKVNNDKKIQLYPNPANDQLTIDCSNLEEAINSYTISDISGKILISSKTVDKNSKMSINTQSLSTGTYFLFLNTKERLIIKKFSILK